MSSISTLLGAKSDDTTSWTFHEGLEVSLLGNYINDVFENVVNDMQEHFGNKVDAEEFVSEELTISPESKPRKSLTLDWCK